MAKSPAVIEHNEIAVIQPLDVNQIIERTAIVRQVLDKVMTEETHYGVIPGCKKPSLFKAGAEKIAVTFQLAIDVDIEDLSEIGIIRYRAKAIAKGPAGQFLGSSYGECSSTEEKYRWRKAYKEEWENTDEDKRRIKQYSNYRVTQVHTNPADVANTILQMADKRAYVAVVRKVTAASDVFTQDVENLHSELVEDDDLQPTETPAAKPAAKEKASTNKGAAKSEDSPPKNDNPTSTKPLAASALKLLQAKLNTSNASAEDLCKHFGINAMTELTMDKINDAFAWIKEQSANT